MSQKIIMYGQPEPRNPGKQWDLDLPISNLIKFYQHENPPLKLKIYTTVKTIHTPTHGNHFSANEHTETFLLTTASFSYCG